MSPSERPSREFPYRKMPGDFRGFFRRNTLWLGPDHLLLVDSSRFSETYKRFYLRDIQSIIIRKTPRFVLPYYWVILVVAALIALLIVAGQSSMKFFWAMGSVLSVFAGLAIYLYVVSMFQSCTCHLITRVSKVELRSLFRLRSARKFADAIAPQIISVQGNLPDGWVERSTTLAELSTAADRNPEEGVEAPSDDSFSPLAVAVFILLLIDAGLSWLQVRGRGDAALSVPNLVNMIALATCGTIAIVQLSRRKGGRALCGLVLSGLMVVAGATYGGVLVESFDQQFYHKTFGSLMDYPGMRMLAIVESVLDLAVAIPGLLLALRRPRSTRKPTSLFDSGASQT